MASRFCQPPDNERASTSRSSNPARPNISAKWTLGSTSPADKCSDRLLDNSPDARAGDEPRVLFHVTELQSLAHRTLPLSGCSVPARIRNSVDFPEPFGPITPMRSPSETVNETSSNSGFAPNAFEIFCALMIGGNRTRAPRMFETIVKYRLSASRTVLRSRIGPASQMVSIAGNGSKIGSAT